MTTYEAICDWAWGLRTTQEMIDVAKKNGHKLERENKVIHAIHLNGKPDFSFRLRH